MNPYADVAFLTRLLVLLTGYVKNPDTTPRGKLFITAVCSLGTDASPNDVAPDELGCAETVDTIHQKAFGSFISGSALTISTAALYKILTKGGSWQSVAVPLPGDIVISPTGLGTNPDMPHGHIGYVSTDGRIMSNTSSTGLFMENYTMDTWRERYHVKGGYPVLFFRKSKV